MDFQDFIDISYNYFSELEERKIDKNLSYQIIEELNKEKLVIISGFAGINKTSIVKTIIEKTNYKNNFLYINKELDLKNKLKNANDLKSLIADIQEKNNLKLIILENVSKIKNIKELIKIIYKKGFKIIIIGNEIKVGNKKEFEIFDEKKQKFEYNNFYKKNSNEKNTIIMQTNAIIFKEIIEKYSIKNFDSFLYTLKTIANYNELNSINHIIKNINQIIKISKVTFFEYLKFLKQSKTLKQIYLYDFKKEKIIDIKTKFYFSDINFRNSLYNFLIPENILKENFIFMELKKRGFDIFSGRNGTYNFSFFAKKYFPNKMLQETLYIDFCYKKQKQELMKKVHKMQKIPNPRNSTNSRIILINNNQINIRKKIYDNVQILTIDEFLKKY